MQRLRISAISYLNTAPLMWDFEHTPAGSDFEISYTVPSLCAAGLREGSADIGIIPAAAYASIPGLSLIPGVAIASLRPVRSILLVSKVPLEKIRTVAMDRSSLTSVSLLQVLFAKWWDGARTYSFMAPDLHDMLSHNDAALLIGDPALRVDRSHYLTWDLAEEWIRFSGKPFVFAFWVVRQDALRNEQSSIDLSGTFQASRDHGVEPANLQKIASEWASRIGMTESDAKSYLTWNIHYYLDAECLAGLKLFYSYAQQCGMLPATPELRFLEAARTATI